MRGWEPGPQHHLQVSGFPRPPSRQWPRGSLRKMPPELSGLAEPKGGNPFSVDLTSFPFPEVSEVDLPFPGTAGPHSCESSNRGTREARGRRIASCNRCLTGFVTSRRCDGISGHRQATRAEHVESEDPEAPPHPAREPHVGPDENGRLQRDPDAPRGRVHFPSEEDGSRAEGRELLGPGPPGRLRAREGSRASSPRLGLLVFRTSQLRFRLK